MLAVNTPLLDVLITSFDDVEKVYVFDPTLEVKVVPFGKTMLVTGVEGVTDKAICALAETKDLGV
jgi:hypothetical protein